MDARSVYFSYLSINYPSLTNSVQFRPPACFATGWRLFFSLLLLLLCQLHATSAICYSCAVSLAVDDFTRPSQTCYNGQGTRGGATRVLSCNGTWWCIINKATMFHRAPFEFLLLRPSSIGQFRLPGLPGLSGHLPFDVPKRFDQSTIKSHNAKRDTDGVKFFQATSNDLST